EVLRTRFYGEFEPEPVVAATASVSVTVIDLRSVHPELREAQLQRNVEEEICQPFDLARGPMIRVRAFRMGEDDWGLTVVLHHIASDFLSWRVLCRELTPLYQGLLDGQQSSLAELTIQYRDFARWQQEWLQGPECENHLRYWRKNLAGIPAVLDLPFARPRPPAQSFHGACEFMALPPELHGQLTDLSRREEVTLFMTLLAAFVALLGRYTKREDLVIGSPAAGRYRAELEELIGFFANIMVLRTSLKGDPTFSELLRRTREVVLDALAHQEVPFAKLVQELRPARSASHLPLFQIVFMLQQELAASFRLPGITATDIDVDTGTAKFDLMLTVLEGEQGLRCCAEYNTSLFEKTDIHRMLLEYQRLLQAVVAQPDMKISEFKLAN
ncbi:MAG: condensation domain-containing protein, partial [Limisphaerales bacterium]